MYLVDTDVVSAGGPSKKPPPLLVAWMDEHSAHLYVSAVSIAEIEAGIARLRRLGAGRTADDLTAWLDTLLHLYAERVLPFYAERVLPFEVRAARIAGSLADRARGAGDAPGLAASRSPQPRSCAASRS